MLRIFVNKKPKHGNESIDNGNVIFICTQDRDI